MNNNHRPYIRKSTRECLDMNAELFQTDNEGNIRDPNNPEIILTEDNKVKGHVPGLEIHVNRNPTGFRRWVKVDKLCKKMIYYKYGKMEIKKPA